MAGTKPETWQTPQLCEFLQQNGLGALTGTVKEHGVAGLDVLLLTEGELQSMLNITQPQAAKIKSLVSDAAAPAPAPGTAAAVAPACAASTMAAAVNAANAENDFTLDAVPRVSEEPELYGDAQAQAEMVRATSVRVAATPYAAAAANPYAAAAAPAAAATPYAAAAATPYAAAAAPAAAATPYAAAAAPAAAANPYAAAAAPAAAANPYATAAAPAAAANPYATAAAPAAAANPYAAAAAPAAAAPAVAVAAPVAVATATAVAAPVAVAAPARGTPAGPALPAGTAHLKLDATCVEAYQRAVASISKLEGEGVAQRLPAARQKLAGLSKRLQLQKTKFEQLRAEEAEQSKKVNELEDGKWYPGKYLLGSGKRDEKMDRYKEKLNSASAKVRAAGIELEQLCTQEAAAKKEVAELETDCRELDAAREYASAVLQSAFAGGMVGDDTENTLENEVASLGPKAQEVRRFKTVYSQAYELFRASKEALEQANQLLESAAALARADMVANVFQPGMFNPGMGNVMIDMMKRAQMQQGIQLCHQAGDLAIKGRKMIPDMPRVDVKKLQRCSMGFGMMDVVFDNIISDMRVAQQIAGILHEVRDALGDVTYGCRWLEGWLKGRIDQDLTNLEAALASRRAQLHAHRSKLLAAWIEARAKGAKQEAGPPAVGVPVHAAQGFVM
ncbi:hypothetical protein HYH02_008438 [Chlamydomonas schloesseri]|uniref:SAM domain-containing protein n=1 Tax=Chlamydomonas schloesseri TaxID=2026947 RepID=A0A835WFV7_9CHLO|nr:hypothetical protein HYH02_008438 [Chlamydomonas schloesseri]|eukprot:KAG2446446.1 hypothetical protein HYH02_008438 [Chlamydomonas schloesseri]